MRTSAKKIETLSYGRKKRLRASSRCVMATIAPRNSPRWNCHLQLKPHPKREKLRQHHLGKSHERRERRRREPARWHDQPIYPLAPTTNHLLTAVSSPEDTSHPTSSLAPNAWKLPSRTYVLISRKDNQFYEGLLTADSMMIVGGRTHPVPQRVASGSGLRRW